MKKKPIRISPGAGQGNGADIKLGLPTKNNGRLTSVQIEDQAEELFRWMIDTIHGAVSRETMKKYNHWEVNRFEKGCGL